MQDQIEVAAYAQFEESILHRFAHALEQPWGRGLRSRPGGCALAAHPPLLTPRSSRQIQHRIDFNERAARQAGDADRRARGMRLLKVRGHDFVDAREMREIGQVYGKFHRVVEAAAGLRRHRLQIPEYTIDLRLDAIGELHGCRVESDLTRQIHRVAATYRLCIRAYRLRCGSTMDRLLH